MRTNGRSIHFHFIDSPQTVRGSWVHTKENPRKMQTLFRDKLSLFQMVVTLKYVS